MKDNPLRKVIDVGNDSKMSIEDIQRYFNMFSENGRLIDDILSRLESCFFNFLKI